MMKELDIISISKSDFRNVLKITSELFYMKNYVLNKKHKSRYKGIEVK